MNIKTLDALELAGILTISETDTSVTVTLRIDKSVREVPTLPAPVKRKRLGKKQRLALRAVESHGPMIGDVLDEAIRQTIRVPGIRDTRQQNARNALLSLHDRGLVVIDGDFVKLA